MLHLVWIRVCVSTRDPDALSHFCYQTKQVDLIFSNDTLNVEYKEGAQEDSQREYSYVVILIFLCVGQAFSVDEHHVYSFAAGLRLYFFNASHHPQALGARVGSVADAKAPLPFFTNNPVYKERFAFAVLANN